MFLLNRIILFLNWLAIVGLLFSYMAVLVSPLTFTWPSFFGLAFPYLFLSNVLCLVYWLLFNKFRMLYSGIALFFGLTFFNQSFNFYGADSVPLEGVEKSKVLNYNVRLFDLYNWTENNKTKKQIFTFLKEEDADIYCFQEFFHQDSSERFVTRDSLVKILRAKHIAEAYTHKLIKRQYFGLAILSVYPILDQGKIEFPNDKNNNGMWVDVKRKTDTLRVFNVHLSSLRFQLPDYDYIGIEYGKGFAVKKEKEQRILSRIEEAFKKRVVQTEIVLNEVKKSPYPVVLCGDFNDTPVSYCYSQFQDVLNDAFAGSGFGWGTTYTGGLPFLRIDYIWHSENVSSTGFKVHSQKLSDHYPISCTIYR